jgi:hypothetical protein
MESKNVGIVTVHTGFNYGTSLQAYAVKELVISLGYRPQLFWYKESLMPGRDVRLDKIFVMLKRTITKPRLLKKTFMTYKKSMSHKVTDENKESFFIFTKMNLDVNKISYKNLEGVAKSDNYLAFVCGSDQIWNATNIYVDPLLYLRFAPKAKRISYAPSFGKNEVPDYNTEIIKEYISEFAHISVREEQGAQIVKGLINENVPVVLDPTLAMSREFWLSKIFTKSEKYILFYFLDTPRSDNINIIKEIQKTMNLPVLALPYKFDAFKDIKNLSYVNAGPFEFVELIANASFVCTDSFHGAAFSVNMNVPFYVFGRNYGTATEQSSRITSLFKILNLEDRLISKDTEITMENLSVDFNKCNVLLEKERDSSKAYLKGALESVENNKG